MRAIRMLLLAVACLAAGAAGAADRALLIGIGRYQNLPPEMTLHGPKNDVPAIRDLLTGTLGFAPDAIRVLMDEQATRAAMIGGIEDWLIDGTKAGDRVFLFFSGHGLQVKDRNGDEPDGLDEAISTYDIEAVDGEWANVVLDDDLDGLIARMAGRQVTIVVDACHSGTISRSLSPLAATGEAGARFLPRPTAEAGARPKTRGIRIDVGVVDRPEQARISGVTTWSAAAPYQVAWDDTRLPEEHRQGVFTAAFVAGHTQGDGNGNGQVSNSELLTYVKTESSAYCALEKSCQSLDPQLDIVETALGADVSKPEEQVAVAPPIEVIGDILGTVDTGDVALALDRDPAMKAGDIFRISVTSRDGGGLVLLDVAEDGTATQIFPNEFARKITPLSPGRMLTLPDDDYGFDFEASGKGRNMLVALVVADPLDLERLAPASQGITTTLDATRTISAIVGDLGKVWTRDAENRAIRWSVATLAYTVE
ncbi:caspase family protein [Ensifer soli]|uniref:caspase family protein n=1 Tax=Ciceribacter sp. sgz301302 TaxID=3342379 RepID=UPI0035BA393D